MKINNRERKALEFLIEFFTDSDCDVLQDEPPQDTPEYTLWRARLEEIFPSANEHLDTIRGLGKRLLDEPLSQDYVCITCGLSLDDHEAQLEHYNQGHRVTP